MKTDQHAFKFVGHSTEIIQQSKIKGPLKAEIVTLMIHFSISNNPFGTYHSVLRNGFNLQEKSLTDSVLVLNCHRMTRHFFLLTKVPCHNNNATVGYGEFYFSFTLGWTL